MNRFRWDLWTEGAAYAVALAALPVIGSAFLDHKVSPAEWSMIGTAAGGAFLAYLKTHRPQVEMPALPPELVQAWERHHAEVERAALALLLERLNPKSAPGAASGAGVEAK